MERTKFSYPSRTHCCIVAGIFLFSSHHYVTAKGQESADEVLEKCKAAMAPPIQYRLRAQGMEFFVHLKVLPDGSIGMREEMSMAISNKVLLLLKRECYEMYPDEELAIDVQYNYDMVVAHASRYATAIQSVVDGQIPGSSAIEGTVDHDGKRCIQVHTSALPETAESAANEILFGNTVVPSGHRFLIEEDTCVLVNVQALSTTGVPIATAQFDDVKPGIHLPDSLFSVPDEFRIERAKSGEDQMEMESAMLLEILDRRRIKPRPPIVPVFREQPPRKSLPVERDPETGRLVWNGPPPMRLRDPDTNELVPAPARPFFRIALALNIAVLAGVGFWYMTRRTRAKSQ